MSVRFPYYEYFLNSDNLLLLVYYLSGTTDVRLIFDPTPAHWDDMATGENGAEVPGKFRKVILSVKSGGVDGDNITHAKETDLKDDVIIEASVEEKIGNKSDHADGRREKKCRCLKALFVIIGIFGVIAAIALIIVTVLTSIATKAYDAEQSSRMVAMVLLAVSAAVTMCLIIYGQVAIFKKRPKSVYMAAVTLLLLAIVQALIAGVSAKVEPADETKLLKSLTESFSQAKEDNQRHVKIWALTQSDLNCCGVYSPEDYRSSNLPYYFPPNVPISCCPTYDSSRSNLVQERDRELCKVKKSYYTTGCKDLVLTVFKEMSTMVFAVSILLIVIQVLLLIIGAVLFRRKSHKVGETSD